MDTLEAGRSSPSAPPLQGVHQTGSTPAIEQGRPLPEKYRFLLFADKREVELVWNGKTREVCTAILPFQTLEHIDEPRKETGRAGASPASEGAPPEQFQEELIDMSGRQIKGWTNKLIWGDNKLILASLKSGALHQQIKEAGGLKLIYIDPPFDVGADFSMDIEIGGETFHKEPNLLEQIAYRDTWGRGADSFIAMIYERAVLMRDLMHSEGCIYVHCDWRVNAFVRLALNEVFGTNNFLNEITWKRSDAHSNSGFYGVNTDSIFLFKKGESCVWNEQYMPYSQEYIEEQYGSSLLSVAGISAAERPLSRGLAPSGTPRRLAGWIRRRWQGLAASTQRLGIIGASAFRWVLAAGRTAPPLAPPANARQPAMSSAGQGQFIPSH